MQAICIPFTKDGDLVEYVGYLLNDEEESKCHASGFYQSDNGNWKDRFVWKPLDAMIKQGVPIKEVYGIFEFVKRGQNYGIRFVEEC